MAYTLQFVFLAVTFVGLYECVSHHAVFVQDNATRVHSGPIFRVEPQVQTTEQPKPTPQPLDCAIREDGAYLPEKVKCSRLYFVCSHSVSRFQWCPHDTVFNSEKGECDFYDNVKDCPPINKLTPKPTTTTQAPSNTSQSQ